MKKLLIRFAFWILRKQGEAVRLPEDIYKHKFMIGDSVYKVRLYTMNSSIYERASIEIEFVEERYL